MGVPFYLTRNLLSQPIGTDNVIGGLTGKTCTCAARLGLAGQTAAGIFAVRLGKEFRQPLLF